MYKEPVFQKAFNLSWEKLPPVFYKRYSNRPYSYDINSVAGEMEISFSKLMACFMPFFKLLHILVPYQGKNIPVTVDFCSQVNSSRIYFDRTFYFPNKKPYQFKSYLQVKKDNEVIEFMPFGFGWRMQYVYDGKKIIMLHKGYILRIFTLHIPLPLEIFIGKGYAEEKVIDDHSYHVTMTMSHPFFGILYHYSGNFTFVR